jgi:hypothetical protein
MATYTYVDLTILEGARLADLNGISVDLRDACKMAKSLKNELNSKKPNWQLVEPYSIAISVKYSRAFVTGVRERLGTQDLSALSPSQREAHERLRAYRDKHVAHSVNAYEENLPRANYCAERVQQDGITAISCSHGRVASLSQVDLDNVIEITTLLHRHVESLMVQEKENLLGIVRAMPLETVLMGGQKAFSVGRNTHLNRARKR